MKNKYEWLENPQSEKQIQVILDALKPRAKRISKALAFTLIVISLLSLPGGKPGITIQKTKYENMMEVHFDAKNV